MQGTKIEKEVKLSLFANKMTMHVEDAKELTKRLWIFTFNQVSRYQINIQNSLYVYALATNENENLKTIPFTTASYNIFSNKFNQKNARPHQKL